MKLLLLNPPGKKLYVRDYYCSSTSKAAYLFHPLDLINMSGLLKREHELVFLDCILKKLGDEECLNFIGREAPGAIISMTGSVSWAEDQVLFARIKQRFPTIKLILNGDIFFDDPLSFIREHPFIDGITMDFISDSINPYLRGDWAGVTNFVYRGEQGAVQAPTVLQRHISIGVPVQEIFIDREYTFPFARSHPYATVLTNYGCPWKCKFCIASEMEFRWRPLSELFAELKKIHEMGIRELFFKDYTFGLPKKNARDLLEHMVSAGYGFSWTCYSRVDVLDEPMMKLMKKAGCHTIIFGVESGSNRVLQAQVKGFKTGAVVKGFRLARQVGIDTVATFVLGLPEDDEKSIKKTIRFARYIDCDYASFNVAVPRTGTEMRQEAIKDGLIDGKRVDFDHSGQEIAMPTRVLSLATLKKFRTQAIMDFYFRVGYIVKRFKKLQSWDQFKIQARMALALWNSA